MMVAYENIGPLPARRADRRCPRVKVLFVYPDYDVVLEPKTGRVLRVEPGGWYSEGLACLSAILKADGHKVSLYHLVRPASREEFMARVKAEAPDLIGFSTATRAFSASCQLAEWIKAELDVPIVVGSYHAIYVPEQTSSIPYFDAVCTGEGEHPLRELAARVAQGLPYHDIPGLWVRTADGVVRNGPGRYVEDLDEVPIPDYGLFDFGKLLSSQIKTAIVILSRGCPYACTYCWNNSLKNSGRKPPVRFMSPKRCIERLERLREVYPDVRYLSFRDDVLPWKEGWLEEFAQLYIERINLPFSCNFRANFVTHTIMKILRRMGCYQVFFGVESGNDYIRNDVLKRRMSREEIITAFAACRAEGIGTVSYNMIGLPFEDMPKVLDTIKLNAEIKADIPLNPRYHPFPGTELFDLSVQSGFLPADFDYQEELFLEQPGLTNADLSFLLRYFKRFVGLYRWAYSLRPSLRGRAERMLDRIFLSRWLPRRFLTWLADRSDRGMERAKSVMRRRSPRVYLWLRDRVRRVPVSKTPAAAA